MAASPLVRLPELRCWPDDRAPPGDPERLGEFLRDHRQILVMTGAGCSTRSGIPAYRNADGRWQHRSPILYQDFLRSQTMRRRYWARSFFGWSAMQHARPNGAHRALVALEAAGKVSALVTQNVDGLHAAAGSRQVIELHGSLRQVACLECGKEVSRRQLQQRLAELNPDWDPEVLGMNPDGDAELDERAYPGFRIAGCAGCGGPLKPDVVFFGESIPAARVESVRAALAESDAVLVVGTSLVVFSGYRVVREAAAAGLPVAAVNDGRTRADGQLSFKVAGDCGTALSEAVARLGR